MPSKCQRNQWKLRTHKIKPIVTDKSDTGSKFRTWYWNESANDNNSDSEEEKSDEERSDLEAEKASTEQVTCPDVCMVEFNSIRKVKRYFVDGT